SIAFIASIRRWFTIRRAADLDCRSPGTSLKRTAAELRSVANPVTGASSRSGFRVVTCRNVQPKAIRGTFLPKILIVEDEPGIVVGLKDNCEYEGFDVLVATNGEDGLRMALCDVPDLIVLDVMLPRLSGLDVCRAIRRKGRDTPIIMLT